MSYDVAFLLGYPEISGGTNVILEHALGLRERGFNVAIVTELPFDPQRLAWKPAAMELELLAHADCRERIFDLSIATWWRSVYDLPFVPAKRQAYFCQSIESRFFSSTDPDMKALADYTYRQPLPIVTEATWIARHLESHYGRDCSLVLNGIDKEVFRPDGSALAERPEDQIRVLVEGPLGVPFKRVEDTIALCQQAGMKDIWLLTSSACDSYPGVSRVCSRIPMPEVGTVYRSCDVLVKLSTVEGMFGPPLEMMHCGGTAITSDVTGHDEYMRHGENGIVIRKGEDAEVIKYLRALDHDRDFLSQLKSGGQATADAWPDWSRSFDGMAEFVRKTCAAPINESVLQDVMLRQLEAALRLAGPLHESMISDLSGSEMLKRSLSKLQLKLAKRLGIQQSAPVETNGSLEARRPAEPVPAQATRRPELSSSRLRLAFVGDVTRFASHMLANQTTPIAVHCWHAEGKLPASLQAQIAAFSPDVTIVFEPERLSPHDFEHLPGYVLGYSVDVMREENWERLSASFAHSKRDQRAIIHADTNTLADLLRADISALAPVPLPIDLGLAGSPDGFDQWQQRRLDVIVRDDVELARRLNEMLSMPAVLSGSGLTGDDRMATLTAQQARFCVYPLESLGMPFLASAKVLRDIAAGCIVVAGELKPDYGLMPGEHYLYYSHQSELGTLLRAALRQPDRQDVMRRRAAERVCHFDASSTYQRLLSEQLVGQVWSVDWSGNQRAANSAIRVSAGGSSNASR